MFIPGKFRRSEIFLRRKSIRWKEFLKKCVGRNFAKGNLVVRDYNVYLCSLVEGGECLQITRCVKFMYNKLPVFITIKDI